MNNIKWKRVCIALFMAYICAQFARNCATTSTVSVPEWEGCESVCIADSATEESLTMSQYYDAILAGTESFEGTEHQWRELFFLRHSKWALEAEAYGIPAAVTLAQAGLETNFGRSGLYKKSNNCFGIKCFSKKCKRGHCLNFSDDNHKDFFMKYKSPYDSFKHRAKWLSGRKNYKVCFECGSDYECWAYKLKAGGYATDPLYAQKLISIMDTHQLYNYSENEELL